MKSVAEHHWDYPLILESDLIDIFRYVEPTAQNASAYGPELLKLFLSVCTEIEAVLKDLARECAPELSAATKKQASMRDYRQFIQEKLRIEFDRVGVKFLGSDIVIEPWNAWWRDGPNDERVAVNERLPWWKAYTDVKHDRAKNYPKANLDNLLSAMAALMIAAACFFRHANSNVMPRCTQIIDYASGRYGSNNVTTKVEGHHLVISQPHFDISPVEKLV